MKFRPCIDLHGGVVKQIVGGTLNDAEAPTENFVSDLSAAHYASLYKRDGLIGGHVIMLGGGNDGPAREALAAHPGALHVGGGVTADNARAWLDAGASHVIVTSCVRPCFDVAMRHRMSRQWIFQDGELSEQRLDAVVAAVGSDKLILDLSCRKRDGKYYVVTDRWQNFTSLEVCKETLDRLGEKCAEFLVHGVDVEGTRLGIDDELVVLLGATSPLPVTYAGGAASLEDLSRVEKLGGGKVDLTIGSALDIFGGAVPYADVVAWHDARQ